MDGFCSKSIQANRLSTLAHAAECLAKAAATLSEAARSAAEAFSSENSASIPQPDGSNTLNFGTGPDGARKDTGQAPQKGDNSRDDEHTDPGHSEHLASGGQKSKSGGDLSPSSAGPTSLGHLPADQNRPSLAVSPRTGITPEAHQPYRILVDNEADVLLFVCALISKRCKVICYMTCNDPSLRLYKRLIEEVVETPVNVMTKITDQIGKEFLESNGSVLLVPESLVPNIDIEGKDSWIIHVGWPSNKQQYESQIRAHRAQNNIMVASSEDESLYPAGTEIMSQTEPWPKDGDSFRISVAILRALFDLKLAAIPLEMKEKLYQDWIQFHGPHGPRYVKSWTPNTLVYRANLYLLDVLQYKSPELNAMGSDVQLEATLPEVSAGFVVQNGLEPAVEEGILRVKPSPPGLNPARTSFVPSGAVSLNDGGLAGPSGLASRTAPVPPSTHGSRYQDSLGPDSARLSKSSTPAPPEQTEFKPTPGRTYFAIEELFDAIPLICFMASKYDKMICFLEGQGSLSQYQQLFSHIIPNLVVAPKTMNSDKANEDAAIEFVEHSTPAVLLLAYSMTKLPTILGQNWTGCCIYWGFHVPIRQAKKHLSQLACLSTSIIMTVAQRDSLNVPLTDFKEHPSATTLLDLGSNSPLWPMRNATKSVLMSEDKLVRGLYATRLHGLGVASRTAISAEEVALRVNQYAARVLLRGNPEDGSKNFPPVFKRLLTSRKAVKDFELQSAVDAGLLSVG